ncbi:SPT3 Dosage dependent suppressor of Ty-induced promoter mutations-like protein [Podila horticola]|nr:SPT3 Dosage dependent suppressor of Ty-induced promoter mutations-like protein [Podila horticola]
MISYSLEARIIQKKDQLEELSATGVPIPAPIVEEVRTGQQFLIKLQLTRTFHANSFSLDQALKFPSIRVGRREAINTAGESRTDAEPLTLQIIVHLAKGGQVRKGACAKCCHKFGPASPILVLLDPLTPSITEPASFAHIDTTSGAATLLAKVICSSTDHGERGNKDRYIFEFRLKRSSTMPAVTAGLEDMDDEGETLATCVTTPIMCSGHHKAKRAYPQQRPTRVPKGVPTPKTKIIKRHKSAPNINMPPSVVHPGTERDDSIHNAGPMGNNPPFRTGLSFLPNHTSQMPTIPYHDRLNNMDMRQECSLNSQFMTRAQNEPLHPYQHRSPRIIEVRPDQGPVRRTTDVVLRGLFFREGMIPYFGCFPAQSIVVETANLILCKAPESPLPGTVNITIYDSAGNNFADLAQFTYTDDSETELLILQLQLRMAHRALEYLHTQATGQKGNAADILRDIPGLSTSPRCGQSMGNMMADENESTEPSDTKTPLMTLNQVEESILITLDQLPPDMDISLQLEDGSNLLHLSILLGFDMLTLRLIEEGCDIEAQDMWSMTPLKYAALKGSETVARALVIAGASSSGAASPQEFYTLLPRRVTPTVAMFGYLLVSCGRCGSSADSSSMASIAEKDEWSSSDDTEVDDEMSEPQVIQPEIASSVSRTDSLENSNSGNGPVMFSKLADAIQGVHMNHGMAPLDQQGLPPLHMMGVDGSVTINTKVAKADTLTRAPEVTPYQSFSHANPESGYHSGVYSEVQDRLKLLHMATLPSQNVQMMVLFKKLAPISPTIGPVAATSTAFPPPLDLFRTGDSFSIEIRLFTTLAEPLTEEQISLPREYFGIRLPHELVKRTGGRPASILTQMTYILNLSVELGKTQNDSSKRSSSETDRDTHRSAGDGIPLHGACKACAKFLHEHKKLSPSRRSKSDPTQYPILQFSIPGGATTVTNTNAGSLNTNNAGVVELRDGVCELKAKVNCSSFHHLLQREWARILAELKAQQKKEQAAGTLSESTSPLSLSSSSSSSSSLSAAKEKMALAVAQLEDPGYVFKFELIHPELNTVVAQFETKPILFQSYSRGRT